MSPPATKSPYARHRFPSEVINHAVWLYFRFPAQPAHSRGDAGGPEHCGQLRDGAAVGAQVGRCLVDSAFDRESAAEMIMRISIAWLSMLALMTVVSDPAF